MTTEELRLKVNVRPHGYGHYQVTMRYRGKLLQCVTDNMPAVDAIKTEGRRPGYIYPTARQALLALRRECIEKGRQLECDRRRAGL